MKNRYLIAIFILTSLVYACEKETDPRIPPDVQFKTGSSYLSKDSTVQKLDSFLVGIVATKTEDDLKTYNVSVAYDGQTDTESKFNAVLEVNERESYEKDVWIHVRDVAGSEQWIFSIVDRDGNITQKKILLTVE